RRVLEDVAALLVPQLLVELGHDRAAPQLVEEVVSGQALDLLGVPVALEVDEDVVAVPSVPGDALELAELLTQAVELAVDLLVAHIGAGNRHPQALVAAH